jgi:alpha-glucosidase
VTITTTQALLHEPDSPDALWWRSAVIYQIYPRSWADSNGDGLGDLPGITARLDHLKALGVDAVWFSPFYTSAQKDAGYDVADYRDIDPIFGTLADCDAMLARAHELGIKVIVDLVPNHTSNLHAWFQQALASAPGTPARDRYHFRDGKGEDGSEPPNDWKSVFGGPAWRRVEDGQWYLHIFDYHQPDLNWDNPEVREEFLDILRFWLERGVDGFRVDVAHGLVKRAGLPDWAEPTVMLGEVEDEQQPTNACPYWDQDGVHDIYPGWRAVLDEFSERTPDKPRMMVAEAWVHPVERMALYLRPEEFHQGFNFDFLEAKWDAAELRECIDHSLRTNDGFGAPTTWVLSNHDVVRHASRLGLPQDAPRPNGIGADDPQPDAELGLRRARAASALMLALPGGAYLYQGEELGLPDSTDLPDEVRQDPTFQFTGGEQLGRDGCRVPLPWVKDAPGFGFGPSAATWLPQPAAYGDLAVDQQEGVPGSTLELYRSMLRLRRERRLGTGGFAWVDGLGPDVVAFDNVDGQGGHTRVVTNIGDEPVPLDPVHGAVLLSSGPLTADGTVPTDTTVWLG